MGRPKGWGAEQTGRAQMRSPGRPAVNQRGVQREFWRRIADGMPSEEAAVACGVSTPVGTRWFRDGGGMPSISLAEPSGRYLSFADREEIAILKARDCGVREIARRLSRHRRRSRGSCGATLRRVAASWSTARRPRSGRPSGPRGGPRWPGLPPTTGSVLMCKTGSLARSQTRTVGRSRVRTCRGRAAAMDVERTAAGGWLGARSRSAAGCGSTSPMMSR